MQKISTCLWFDDQAEEAASYYTGIFDNSRILDISRYSDTAPGQAGRVMTVQFQIEGRDFIALNGGPAFQFNEAVSLVVDCSSQEEVDRYWNALTADGGQESQCGWLKDKYGLSWQIVPDALRELLNGPDPEGAERAMEAMLQMRKIDISALQKAYDGR